MNWFSSVFRGKTGVAAPPDREELDSRLRAAYASYLGGSYAEAEQLYRDLLEDDPGNVDALYFLSVYALTTDRSLEAGDLTQKALEIRPNDPGLWFVQSVASPTRRRVRDAVAAWRTTVALDPGYALARNNLGAALVDDG